MKFEMLLEAVHTSYFLQLVILGETNNTFQVLCEILLNVTIYNSIYWSPEESKRIGRPAA